MLEHRKRPHQRLSPPHWPATTDRAWRDCLRTGMWRDPSKSRSLERVIARRLSIPPEWVLATSSCTAALGVAFLLLDDHAAFYDSRADCQRSVRVCPLTYAATYCWPINLGYEIKWVDCDENGWPVGPVDVGVDLWGRLYDRPCVVLDAAHRVMDTRHADGLRCNRNQAVAYSFGPQKEIPCVDGGALVSPTVGERRAQAESLIQSGQGMPLIGGFKGYMSGPSARAIVAQIGIHKKMKARRQRVLEEYREWFGDDLLTQPGEASGHLCVVRLRTPGHALAAKKRLSRLHIDHSLHYPIPEEIPCPQAKELTQTLLTLPCHQEMRRHDVLLVARAVLTAV